jgi:hypothetical protein
MIEWIHRGIVGPITFEKQRSKNKTETRDGHSKEIEESRTLENSTTELLFESESKFNIGPACNNNILDNLSMPSTELVTESN